MRKAKHTKDEIFDTYVQVLQFMMENRGKSFMNRDIREKLYNNPTESSLKVMVKRVVDFYVDSGIFIKITETTDNTGNIKKLQPNQYRVRLYDNALDEEDDDDYKIALHIPKSTIGRRRLCETVASMITSIPYVTIYSPALKTVIESSIFGLQTDLVPNTLAKVILKQHNLFNKTEGTYPLGIIINVMKSKMDVTVTFENFGNRIELKNTTIKKIAIKEDSFDIYFDNFISLNHVNINQILKIVDSKESTLMEDIQKVKELIIRLPSDEKEKILKDKWDKI